MAVGTGALVALLLLVAVVTVYAWPLEDDRLQRAGVVSMTFTDAEALAREAVAADAADPGVRPECTTRLLSHGRSTERAILLLHGYSACPEQMSGLAQHFFELGYNVYVPRAPRHGLTDTLAHADVLAPDLTSYANAAWNVADALGAETGVAGVSGGGVLATWLAHFRHDSVRRLLVLSPFYQPGPEQVPSFALRPMILGYGSHLLPDVVNSRNFSYAALAQYLQIARNYRLPPATAPLENVAVLVAADDTLIDHPAAMRIPGELARATDARFTTHVLPAELALEHNVVSPERLGTRADEQYRLYQQLYEGP